MIILCITGTNPYSFERLVKAVDLEIAIDHEVTIQLGNTSYRPVNAKYFDFCSQKEMYDHMSKADLIIAQGGYGSISDSLTLGKKVIAVPRKRDLKECLDNQHEIVEYMAKEKYVIACYDVEMLKQMVTDIGKGRVVFSPFHSPNTKKISDIIDEYLSR